MESLAKFREETAAAAMTLYEVAKSEGAAPKLEGIVQNMVSRGLDYQANSAATGLSLDEIALMAKKHLNRDVALLEKLSSPMEGKGIRGVIKATLYRLALITCR